MSATLSPSLLLAVPLAPLAGALVAGLFGRQVGRTGAHVVTILGVAIAFVLSAYVLGSVVNDGAYFNATIFYLFYSHFDTVKISLDDSRPRP